MSSKKSKAADKEFELLIRECKVYNKQIAGATGVADNTDASADTKTNFMEQSVKSINDVVKIGDDLYRTVKDLVKDGETMNRDTRLTAQGFREVFTKWADAAKLEYFREKLGFKEFMTEFPVLSRYAICMGNYSNSAFRKMLDKVSRTKHPPPTQRPKGYMEDQWIRRQSDYMKYLAESYMKHPDKMQSNAIWQTTYKILKKEFDEFRDKYSDVETNVKETKERLKASYAKDFIDRLATGAQSFKNKRDEADLLYILKNKLFKHKFKLVLKELLATRKPTRHTAQGLGHGPENQDKKPTITMVEHIDPARINEVPRHMLLSDADARALPGYQTPLEPIEE